MNRNQTHTNRTNRWAGILILLTAVIVGLTVGFFSSAAQTDRLAPTTPRYQISAWGFTGPNSTGHGAYVLDTFTGEVWLVGESPARKMADKLR